MGSFRGPLVPRLVFKAKFFPYHLVWFSQKPSQKGKSPFTNRKTKFVEREDISRIPVIVAGGAWDCHLQLYLTGPAAAKPVIQACKRRPVYDDK